MKNLALIAALALAVFGSKIAFAAEEHAANVKCKVGTEVTEMSAEDCKAKGGEEVKEEAK